jgi:hypothetical protein
VYCAAAGSQGSSAPAAPPLGVVTLSDATTGISVDPGIGADGVATSNPFADPASLATVARALRGL